jgi:hypothetical protein
LVRLPNRLQVPLVDGQAPNTPGRVKVKVAFAISLSYGINHCAFD